MLRRIGQLPALFRPLWTASPPLVGTGLAMLLLLAAAVLGLAIDPRTITGAPAWLKPAKFAVSIAIYTLTLAWVFTHLEGWLRTRRLVGAITAATLGLEIVIIVLQAWRGTTSHFNVGTTFDQALWTVMGLAIVLQTLTSVAVAVALWRQRFADRALGWALRLGMAMTIIGASSGGLMTSPTSLQVAEARKTRHMAIAGAHTVGAPDGGPGLPGTGWSVEHGDIRVAHFVGLHGLQVMPLILLALPRRRLSEAQRVRLIVTAAASYLALFALLLWQALRGQALFQPDPTTLAVFAVWAIGTAAVVGAVTSGGMLRAIDPSTNGGR